MPSTSTAEPLLGASLKDRITGFAGRCTALMRNVTGCDQAFLQPRLKDDGTLPDGHWFDVTRLEATGEPRIEIAAAAAAPGGDMSVLQARGLRM